MIVDLSSQLAAVQLTSSPNDHILTNINVWSPDSRWLVYDIRSGSEFTGTRIERIDVHSKAVELLYEARPGAACGVATYDRAGARVVFIGSPELPTADWPYGLTRRRGLIVDVDTRHPRAARPLDAMNYAPPFVPGALRGGSHLHVFSPDGRCVSFTYEDEILARLDALPGAPPHDSNQRNIGVAVPGPVRVNRNHPHNHDGDFFAVVVTRTVEYPRPGSDEISRAFDEGWVGVDGYLRPDGTRQRRAIAFHGLVRADDGEQHSEVFIVDMPEVMTLPGDGLLEGTGTRRPAPPRGTVQRRLTCTDDRPFRGTALQPRHWLHSSPDGGQIAFLMKDEEGIVQLWSVSPNGGSPRQLSHLPWDVTSAFSWSPDGCFVAHVADGSVFLTEIGTGCSFRLTPRHTGDTGPQALACVFSPNGRSIAFQQQVNGHTQLFVVNSLSP